MYQAILVPLAAQLPKQLIQPSRARWPGFTSPTVPLIVVLVIPTESMVSEN